MIDPDPDEANWKDPREPTPEELSLIARIILNWGRFDTFITTAAQLAFPMDLDDGQLLIVPLGTDRKIQIIKRKLERRGGLTPEMEAVFRDLAHVVGTLREERNTISHGAVGSDTNGEPLFFGLQKWASFGFHELPRILERAQYAVHIAIALIKLLMGGRSDPRPSRPK